MIKAGFQKLSGGLDITYATVKLAIVVKLEAQVLQDRTGQLGEQ